MIQDVVPAEITGEQGFAAIILRATARLFSSGHIPVIKMELILSINRISAGLNVKASTSMFTDFARYSGLSKENQVLCATGDFIDLVDKIAWYAAHFALEAQIDLR